MHNGISNIYAVKPDKLEIWTKQRVCPQTVNISRYMKHSAYFGVTKSTTRTNI